MGVLVGVAGAVIVTSVTSHGAPTANVEIG